MILSFILLKRLIRQTLLKIITVSTLWTKRNANEKLRCNTEIISPGSLLPGNLIVSVSRLMFLDDVISPSWEACINNLISLFSVIGVSWKVINRRRRKRRIISKYKVRAYSVSFFLFLSSRVTGEIDCWIYVCVQNIKE